MAQRKWTFWYSPTSYASLAATRGSLGLFCLIGPTGVAIYELIMCYNNVENCFQQEYGKTLVDVLVAVVVVSY